jgi:hypothetical protein
MIVIAQSALRESNPLIQLGRLTPLPIGQEHTRKERESNPQGSSLDCFRNSCHRPLACPSNQTSVYFHRPAHGACSVRRARPLAAAAGIEPAFVSLTGSRPTIGLHRNEVGAVGFEPTLSCSRSRRISRLSYTPLTKSTQRELNPHFRRGKAAGYRYIMGALAEINCQRTNNAGCHRRDFSNSGIRRARTVTDLGKNQACCR